MPLMLIIAEVIAEKALSSMPQKVAIEHIDASWLGLLIGGVTTGIAVAGLFLLVGWLLVKYGAVKIGAPIPIAVVPPCEEGKEHRYLITPEVCVNCAAERLLSSQHEAQISELFGKWNSVRDNIGTMAVDIGVIKTDVGNIKTGIVDLQSRRIGR